MPTPSGARKATRAAARPKAAPTKKVAPRAGKMMTESDQQLIARLDREHGGQAPDAVVGRALANKEHRQIAVPKTPRASKPVQASSEQAMINHANAQSRAARSHSNTTRVAPRAGSATPRKSSGPPLVRSGNGSLQLRGGTRGAWKRDFRGRFA